MFNSCSFLEVGGNKVLVLMWSVGISDMSWIAKKSDARVPSQLMQTDTQTDLAFLTDI